MKAIAVKSLTWIVVGGLVVGAAIYIGFRIWRMGAAADVTRFTPEDVDVLVWIPRVDQATTALVDFTRGVQEAATLRDFLKPETGVDLGDPEGMRRAGIDPEAGLVVFSRHKMVHVLFGVEDADTTLEALVAKFTNLGFPPASKSKGADDITFYRIPDKEDSDLTHAAFASDDGLLVLVYRGGGDDPEAAVKTVLDGPPAGKSFFDSERFKDIERRLGSEGPLIYVDGGSFARDREGNPRAGWLDSAGLPKIATSMVRTRVRTYLEKVAYAAARVQMNKCASEIRMTLSVEDGASLNPASWVASPKTQSPNFGHLLPRDTVMMFRLGLDLDAINDVVLQLGKMGAGISKLGALIGIGPKRGKDPVAALLGDQVHPELEDMHVVSDLLGHLTGHVMVSVVGLDRRAKLADVLEAESVALWLNTVSVVVGAQLKDSKKFFETWWPKRDLLGRMGFKMERVKDERWTAYRVQRNCGKNVKMVTVKGKKRKPVCEHYGLLIKDDVLLVTTGAGSFERVFNVVRKQASDLRSLTREEVARSVLDHGKLFAGGYFSFDGLLRAVRGRNLPSGATRYLAQLYELAFVLETAGGDASGQLLLTR